jgi:hypothetical protein
MDRGWAPWTIMARCARQPERPATELSAALAVSVVFGASAITASCTRVAVIGARMAQPSTQPIGPERLLARNYRRL